MARAFHFAWCRICGTPGHRADCCPVLQLEQRKDPFGEARAHAERRRQAAAYRTRTAAARVDAQNSQRRALAS